MKIYKILGFTLLLNLLTYNHINKAFSTDPFKEEAIKNLSIQKIPHPENKESLEELKKIFHPILMTKEAKKFFDNGFETLYAHSTPKHTGEELLKMFQCLYSKLAEIKADTHKNNKEKSTLQFQLIEERFNFSGHKKVFTTYNPELIEMLKSEKTCEDCYKAHINTLN